MTAVTDSNTSTSSTSVKITPRTNTGKLSGRSWKHLTKSIAKGIGYALLASIAMLSVAALIAGIIAMVNPIGLSMIGTGIAGVVTGGFAFAAENGLVVLIIGVAGGSVAAIAGAIICVVRQCVPINVNSRSGSTPQSGSIASVT